jgi:hypothetical protein
MAGGDAAGAVGKGHQHAALHETAAVMVLVLRQKREFELAVDLTLPHRPDQLDKSGRLDNAETVGFEPCGGSLVYHLRRFLEFGVVSSTGCVTQSSEMRRLMFGIK